MSSEVQKSNEKKVEGSEEKAKSSRKKSLEVEADDTTELKKHLVIKKDDDIAVDVIPLAKKPPVIVDYKLLKEGIISSKRYSSIIRLLQGIDREDLQTLWKLVKTKHGDLRHEDEYERVFPVKVKTAAKLKTEIIKNGNKVLRRTVLTVEQEYEPTTAEEKQDRRNEIKARATLLMALPNKDQLKFHSYQDAKLLMEAIEKRYGGNKESKKVQRTLLKQQYENFAALSSEIMDQTFDRLQKLISQLEIQGEVINQEDINLKLLRSLPSEWKTYALIWRNKVEIETISLDDFTNKVDDTAHGVSTTHSTIHTQDNGVNFVCLDNLYDAVICAFLASQPNSPQLSQEDLEQLHPDDLEEMDLQWEMAMLTIRARRFIKRTGKKLDINGQRVGFDKLKVECFNCHKHGHFARECRFPRNQECKGRGNNTRTIIVETPTQNALIAQDGIRGYDWSYQAEEEQPTNHALMAFTSSGSSSSSDSEVDSCSKTCVKAYASLKEQYDNLSSDYKKSQFNLVSYKAVESNAVRMNNTSAPIIEDWNSDDESEIDYTVRPSTEKIKFVKTVRETDAPKQNKQHPRGNQRNWNNLMSQRLGSDFKMTNKACYVCGSFEHLHYVCDKKVVRPVWNNSRRGIKREFSMARTPQQNGVAERENRTLIEACQLAAGTKLMYALTKYNIVAGFEGMPGNKPTKVVENEASDKSGKHDQEARSESERLNKKEMQTEHTNCSNGINNVSTALLVLSWNQSFDIVVATTPV
ncbi:ribonuclease H-like domain-containing protein [Tanacetum coccineum]